MLIGIHRTINTLTHQAQRVIQTKHCPPFNSIEQHLAFTLNPINKTRPTQRINTDSNALLFSIKTILTMAGG